MKSTPYPGHLSFLMSNGGKGVLCVPHTSPISEKQNALETRFNQAFESFYKTDTSQSMMFPFIFRISRVNLNQSTDSCRFVPI